MKYVLLAIFVLLSAQPSRASLCDMEAAAKVASEHITGMNHSGINHDNMVDHQMAGGMSDMDCCDGEAKDSNHQCDSMAHCGACTAGVMTLAGGISIFSPIDSPRQNITDSDAPLRKFKLPPYRPPIT